jgi:DNA-binding response OmpR family regulator
MKVLLLEDEFMLLSSIKSFLLSKDIVVDCCKSGKEAISASKKNEYDMYILDINVPDISGLDVLKKIRASDKYTPIIIITAMIDIETLEKAYSLGCNEYLKKPFNLRELEIRMNKLAEESDELLVQISDHYVFDIKKNSLYFDSQLQKMTKNQNKFLNVLAQQAGKVVSFKDIRLLVWGNNDISDITIRSLVNRLREELKEDIIETFRGTGYRVIQNFSKKMTKTKKK